MSVSGYKVSKKLLVVLVALLVLVLDSQGLLGLDPGDVTTLKWVVVSYVLGQSMVDAYSAPAQIQAKSAEQQAKTLAEHPSGSPYPTSQLLAAPKRAEPLPDAEPDAE